MELQSSPFWHADNRISFYILGAGVDLDLVIKMWLAQLPNIFREQSSYAVSYWLKLLFGLSSRKLFQTGHRLDHIIIEICVWHWFIKGHYHPIRIRDFYECVNSTSGRPKTAFKPGAFCAIFICLVMSNINIFLFTFMILLSKWFIHRFHIIFRSILWHLFSFVGLGLCNS